MPDEKQRIGRPRQLDIEIMRLLSSAGTGLSATSLALKLIAGKDPKFKDDVSMAVETLDKSAKEMSDKLNEVLDRMLEEQNDERS